MRPSKILIIDHPNCSTSSAVYQFFQTTRTAHTVLKCRSSIDALTLLGIEKDIELIFFDIDLPKLEGLDFLLRVAGEFPRMKLVVHGAKSRTIPGSNTRIIARNEPPATTAKAILDDAEATSGTSASSLSLLELLLLVEQEKLTTFLEITANGEQSRCCFDKGVLLDALYGDKKGEESVLKIISLVDPVVAVKGMPKQKIIQRINRPVSEIIQEARGADAATPEPVDPTPQNDNGPAEVSGEELQTTGNQAGSGQGADIPADHSIQQQNNTQEDCAMSLEEHLAKLKGVNGFKAAAVMNFTGEILVSESVDPNIQLDLVGATFNDIFRTAHSASEKIGLEACSETTIKTPNGIIIMRCSGVKAKVHFHLIMIIAADGNQALGKLEMEKLIPIFMAELA